MSNLISPKCGPIIGITLSFFLFSFFLFLSVNGQFFFFIFLELFWPNKMGRMFGLFYAKIGYLRITMVLALIYF